MLYLAHLYPDYYRNKSGNFIAFKPATFLLKIDKVMI